MKITRDLLTTGRETDKFQTSSNLLGQVERRGMKCENTKERAFNSAPGQVRDLEHFNRVTWLEVTGGIWRLLDKEKTA